MVSRLYDDVESLREENEQLHQLICTLENRIGYLERENERLESIICEQES